VAVVADSVAVVDSAADLAVAHLAAAAAAFISAVTDLAGEIPATHRGRKALKAIPTVPVPLSQVRPDLDRVPMVRVRPVIIRAANNQVMARLMVLAHPVIIPATSQATVRKVIPNTAPVLMARVPPATIRAVNNQGTARPMVPARQAIIHRMSRITVRVLRMARRPPMSIRMSNRRNPTSNSTSNIPTRT